ncbi:MAG: hypothetical protein U0836_09005 [Pirellulales bacterium]
MPYAPMPTGGPAEPVQALDLDSAEAQLTQKLAELERLHREIDVLRTQIGLQSTVIAHVILAEVDLDKLRRWEADWKLTASSKLAPFLPSKTEKPRYVVQDAKEFRELIEALRRQDALEILAEPTVVTVRNRRAQFDDGDTLLEFTPTSIGNEVRFDLRVRHAATVQPPPEAGNMPLGTVVRPKRVSEISTGGNLRPGKGLVLTGLTQTRLGHDAEGQEVARNVGFLVFISLETPTSTPLPPVAGRPVDAVPR